MTKQKKPVNLKGFRDFLPEEKNRRDWLLNKISRITQRFGFSSLETPTLEYAQLLTSNYGQEANKLLYLFEDHGGREVGLRYDQTVPTARVLAQYQNQLPKYFRRWQSQTVFRADKPQKGRYREFRQFDLDVFGSKEPLSDAEILATTYAIFAEIGYPQIKINLNDRQILFRTLSPFADDNIKIESIIQSIDKLDKKSPAAVIDELVTKGLNQKQAQKALEKLAQAEMTTNLVDIMRLSNQLGVPKKALHFSPNLARGLDYYTGMIFEVVIDSPSIDPISLAGGGRYDNLIKNLANLDMPAVGVGLGFDRMVEAAEQLHLIPEVNQTQVMVALYGPETLGESLALADKLRKQDINTEIYPNFDKLTKQFKTANQKGIAYVVLIGTAEKKNGQISIKNLATREQKALKFDQLINLLKQNRSAQ